MIVNEFYMKRKDGITLFRTYSDKGVKIKQNDTGILYDEAIDVETSLNIYQETNIPLEQEIE